MTVEIVKNTVRRGKKVQEITNEYIAAVLSSDIERARAAYKALCDLQDDKKEED
jgi:hypothetical protein